MTSTPVSNLATAQRTDQLLSKAGKLWIAVIGLLFIAFHYNFLYRTIRIGIGDADWSHILIIPFISIYYIHLNRKQVMATERRVCRWGLPLIVAGIAGYVLGIYPIRNDMAMGYSMILTLFGIVLLLLGPAMMRKLWFPIAFLVFAVKVSPAIWSIIASKMQAIAAFGAVVLLDLTSSLTGMEADLRGSTIDLDYFANGEHIIKPMNVAEACAGMRMLMAFLALGVALAFLFPRLWWQRLVMVLMAAPIAIIVNAARVAVLGWLHLIDPAMAEGDFHIFVGMLMLLPAAGLLMLVGWCLDKAVIIEGGPRPAPAPLPFDQDPNHIHLDKPRLINGFSLGAVVVVMLGLSYILLVNHLSDSAVLAWLKGTLNTGAAGIGGALFVAGLIAAWVLIGRAGSGHRLALSQGVVVGMLLIAAVGQFAATNAMGVALNKKAVPLRHGIALSFPEEAGDWVMLHQNPRLSKDVEGELDTKEYFNRWYLNTATGLTKNDVTVKTKQTKLGDMLAGWEGSDEPGQIATVHMTYHTGMLDTVPHVPAKCRVVAGETQVYHKAHTLKLKRQDYRPDPDHPGLILADSTGFEGEVVRLPSDEIEAMIFTGRDDQGHESSALYFFIANGKAMASNHDVRFSFNLKDRYSYYCKVEVMFPGINDPQQIVEHSEALISDLLPEVMACLPDWTQVQDGTYPKEEED